MLVRLRDQERGVALIVALLVTFVVLLLSLFVVQLSLHSTSASSYDRERTQSLTAAEAGLNDFFNVLQKTPPEKLPCNQSGIGLHPGPVTGSVEVFPGTASYKVEAHYYDASTPQPKEIDCALLGQDNPPLAASITSTGTTNGRVSRKMQAWVDLVKERAGGFDAAIVADKGMCVSGNYAVDDPGTSFSADVYVNSGNLCIGAQQGGNMTVEGKIFVHGGSASLGGQMLVRNDVWAWGSVSLADTQTSVQGSVTSSSSGLSGNGSIGGSAKAGTTIACSSKTNPAAIANCSSVLNGQGLVIGGQPILPNSPQIAAPPAVSVPPVCWAPVSADCVATQQDWVNAGYAVQPETSCVAAQAYLQNLTYTGNLVVRVTGCSELVLNQVNVQVNGNLAVFTDGLIRFDTKNVFTGNGGNLYFIVGYQPNVTPASCLAPAQSYASTTPYDILFNNNPDLRSFHVSMYTPGAMIFNNQTKNGGQTSPLTGQLLGGQFCSSNYFSMQFTPVLIPTVSPIAKFGQDVLWIREIA